MYDRGQGGRDKYRFRSYSVNRTTRLWHKAWKTLRDPVWGVRGLKVLVMMMCSYRCCCIWAGCGGPAGSAAARLWTADRRVPDVEGTTAETNRLFSGSCKWFWTEISCDSSFQGLTESLIVYVCVCLTGDLHWQQVLFLQLGQSILNLSASWSTPNEHWNTRTHLVSTCIWVMISDQWISTPAVIKLVVIILIIITVSVYTCWDHLQMWFWSRFWGPDLVSDTQSVSGILI